MHSKNVLFILVFVLLTSCQPSSSTLSEQWKASLSSELDKRQAAFETHATICGLLESTRLAVKEMTSDSVDFMGKALEAHKHCLEKSLFHLNAQNEYTATLKTEIDQKIKLIEQMESSGELSEERLKDIKEDAEDFGLLDIIDIPQKKEALENQLDEYSSGVDRFLNSYKRLHLYLSEARGKAEDHWVRILTNHQETTEPLTFEQFRTQLQKNKDGAVSYKIFMDWYLDVIEARLVENLSFEIREKNNNASLTALQSEVQDRSFQNKRIFAIENIRKKLPTQL